MNIERYSRDLCCLDQGFHVMAPSDRGGGFEGEGNLVRRGEVEAPG